MFSAPDPFLLLPLTPLPQSVFDLFDRTTSAIPSAAQPSRAEASPTPHASTAPAAPARHHDLDLSTLSIAAFDDMPLLLTPEPPQHTAEAEPPRSYRNSSAGAKESIVSAAAATIFPSLVSESSDPLRSMFTDPAELSVRPKSNITCSVLPTLPSLLSTLVSASVTSTKSRVNRSASRAHAEQAKIELARLLPEVSIASFGSTSSSDGKKRRGQKRTLSCARGFDIHAVIAQLKDKLMEHAPQHQDFRVICLSDLVQSSESFDNPHSTVTTGPVSTPSSSLISNLVSGLGLWHPAFHIAVRKTFEQSEPDLLRWVQSESSRLSISGAFSISVHETALQACAASMVGNRLNRLRMFLPYFGYTYHSVPFLSTTVGSLFGVSSGSEAQTSTSTPQHRRNFVLIKEGVVVSDDTQLFCGIDSSLATSSSHALLRQEYPSVLRLDNVRKFLADNSERENVRLNLYLMIAGAALCAFRSCGVVFIDRNAFVDPASCSIVVLERACAFAYDSSRSALVGASFFPRLSGFDKCLMVPDSAKVADALASPELILTPFAELIRVVDTALCDEMLRTLAPPRSDMVSSDAAQNVTDLLRSLVQFLVNKKYSIESPTIGLCDGDLGGFSAAVPGSSSTCSLARSSTSSCFYESRQGIFDAVVRAEVVKRVRLARYPGSFPIRRLPSAPDAVVQILTEFLLAHNLVLLSSDQHQAILGGLVEIFEQFLSSARQHGSSVEDALGVLRRSVSLLFRYDAHLHRATTAMFCDENVERVVSELTGKVSVMEADKSVFDKLQPDGPSIVCFHSI